MSDIAIRATRTVNTTSGSAVGLVRPGLASSMGQVVTSAARLSVAPYSVARGNFLAVDPLIQMQMSIGGVANVVLDASWSSLVDQSWSLFDPVDADLLWPSLSPTGQYLSATSLAVSETVYSVRGDRSSLRTYTALKSSPGGQMSMGVMQGSGVWLVSAFRLVSTAVGGLLSVNTTLGVVSVSVDGRRYQFSLDGMVYGSHPRDSSDSTVTCVGITTYENRVVIGIREGVTTSTYTYVGSSNDGEPMYPLEVMVGGPTSPEMLIYVIAHGANDEMSAVMSLLTGYLSC